MTLTEASALTKKAAVFLILFVISVTIVWVGVSYYSAYQKAHYIPPLEKPTLKYGTLPHPNLGETKTNSSAYNYTLNTEDGKLPNDLPKIIRVYFIPKLGTTLLARDRAKELATNLRFENGPEIVSPTIYRFNDGNGGELTIDVDSGNLKFRRQEASESADLEAEMPDEAKLSLELKDFLSNKDLSKEQLAEGRTKVIYETGAAKNSRFADVYLWQNDVDKLPIITPEFTKGLIHATITKHSDSDQRYLNLDYVYWPIDKTNYETYPLKPINVTFEELKNGKGTVIEEPKSPNVSLTKIYLGYLLSKEYTPYLQPVYVFEGEGFTAISAAIPDENLEPTNK